LAISNFGSIVGKSEEHAMKRALAFSIFVSEEEMFGESPVDVALNLLIAFGRDFQQLFERRLVESLGARAGFVEAKEKSPNDAMDGFRNTFGTAFVKHFSMF